MAVQGSETTSLQVAAEMHVHKQDKHKKTCNLEEDMHPMTLTHTAISVQPSISSGRTC